MVGTYNQTATWWTLGAVDGFGKRSFTAPQSVQVRWQDENRLMLGKMDEQDSSDAAIWFEDTTLIINEGDYFALGDYSGDDPSQPVVLDPTTLTNAYIAQDILDTPSVEGDEYVSKVMLRHNVRF